MEYKALPDEELDAEMPLFSWGKKDVGDEINYKAKLEHKLLLAKQDPEPVFDLTECNLHNVPSGVFSWCKVCRKEVLLLQNNKLKLLNGGGQFKDLILLRVLDLSSNKLSQVPNDIGMLSNLQALYLQYNQLKTLPDTIEHLKNLRVLSLKGNNCKVLPEVICQLQSLRKLDISANPLKNIPNSFCQLKALTVFVLDAENYDHPPKDVCTKGLEQIMRYLCQECGVSYIPPDVNDECCLSLESAVNYSTLVDNWSKIAQTQDSQQQARIEVEKSLQTLFESLSELAISAHQQKRQFFKDLMQDQERIDVELSSAQQRKDVDRQKLLLELSEVEKESNETIQELLEISSVQRNTDALLEELEKERKEFDEMFLSVKNDSLNLCRKEVLELMEQVLENQYKEYQMNMTNSLDRREIVENAHLEVLDLDRKLREIKVQTNLDQKELIAKLLEEEEYQKKAFITLLIKKDGEYGRLTEQIILIESELTNLTLLEMKKKSLKVDFEKSIMEEQREVLTRLLIQLMTQQDIRRQEFDKRLIEMEAKRSQEQVDFWLLQCQRLMDSKPEILKQQENLLDSQVKAILKRADALNYVPLFARSNITMAELLFMSNDDLKELGIGKAEVREEILREVQAGGCTAEAPVTPSAPPLESVKQKSIRARFETECVVCMEQMCTVLFLNCGHVCCCEQCGPTLKLCPLCRGNIERILYLRCTLGGAMAE